MAITRSELIGKKVYNPDASLLGEVSDVGFFVGMNQPTLVVKAADGSLAELPWEMVSSAKDIILMKEIVDISKFKRTQPVVVQAEEETPSANTKRYCTSCGKQLTWIDKYKRWYCYNEKKYV